MCITQPKRVTSMTIISIATICYLKCISVILYKYITSVNINILTPGKKLYATKMKKKQIYRRVREFSTPFSYVIMESSGMV